MAQNHIRWSPTTCKCVIDLLVDEATGNQSLFCIKNICDAHVSIAAPDPDFENKKATVIAARYQALDDNRTRNYAQIEAYTDLEMSAKDKLDCKATVDRITAERKAEYDNILTASNLVFCTNVQDAVKEESGRWGKVRQRIQVQYNLSDEQAEAITFSYSGTGLNRVLTITCGAASGITNQQKQQAQLWCDQNIGMGKVIIV